MLAKIIDKKVLLPKYEIVCGDSGAEQIIFECPEIIDGISLVGVPAYIKVANPLGRVFKGLLTSEKEGNRLKIKWVIGAEATAICGLDKCQIVFEKEDGTLVLNTLVFDLEIKCSVSESADEIILEVNHITKLQNELQNQINELREILTNKSIIYEGSDISLLNNDCEYLTEKEASDNYATFQDCLGLFNQPVLMKEKDKVSLLTNDCKYATEDRVREIIAESK